MIGFMTYALEQGLIERILVFVSVAALLWVTGIAAFAVVAWWLAR